MCFFLAADSAEVADVQVKYDDRGEFILDRNHSKLRQFVAYMIGNGNSSVTIFLEGTETFSRKVQLTVSNFNAVNVQLSFVPNEFCAVSLLLYHMVEKNQRFAVTLRQWISYLDSSLVCSHKTCKVFSLSLILIECVLQMNSRSN